MRLGLDSLVSYVFVSKDDFGEEDVPYDKILKQVPSNLKKR